jgi:hypothetical protein
MKRAPSAKRTGHKEFALQQAMDSGMPMPSGQPRPSQECQHKDENGKFDCVSLNRAKTALVWRTGIYTSEDGSRRACSKRWPTL